ncbi:MAG: hypothetical protein AMXMBFR23_09280 [Chloroflexota bacterium]
MRSPFADWLEAYAKEAREAQVATVRPLLRTAKVTPTRSRPRYLAMIEGKRWKPLAARGRRDAAGVERALTALRRTQRRWTPIVARLPQVTTAAALAPAPSEHPQFTEMLAAARTAMRAAGYSTAEVTEATRFLKESTPEQLGRDMRKYVVEWTGQIDRLAERYLALQAGAALAMAVGRFNVAVATPPSVRSTPQDYLEFATKELASDERALHAALKAGDPFVAWGRAVNLRRDAARRLFAGSIAHAALIASARQSAPDDATLGELAVGYGRLIRGQLAAISAGHAVEWDTMWGAEGADFKAWCAAAAATSPGSGYRAPRSAAISSLASRPAALDGEERTVSGRVTAVEITHRGRKAISRATLTDGTREVTVVLPYIKIDSGGLVPGAWASVSGTWRATSTEAGGGPALEVDRRAIASLGRTHWSERLLQMTDHIFWPVPHGLAVEWSWEPGTDGAGNQLRYGTWLSEKGS